MKLLECLVGLALSLMLVGGLLKNSSELLIKQIEYEKMRSVSADADRALILIGRAIHMAGYQNTNTLLQKKKISSSRDRSLEIQKGVGYGGSDTLIVKYQLPDGINLDCIGNTLSVDRTKHALVHQGFLIKEDSSRPKNQMYRGGSLMCQSLDRQGRIQNSTLMSGVERLRIEEQPASPSQPRLFAISLTMTDGLKIKRIFQRIVATRNAT
jgi:hypothetical protein